MSVSPQMGFREFQSKILLFGEYSVIYDSHALVTPYSAFSGKLAIPASPDERRYSSYSHQELLPFFGYLSQHCSDVLNLDSLERDLDRGLYFDSNIPHGFGLGSSGALCAAVYSSYGKGRELSEIASLKKVFALMESYFHGHSSGIDPLVSFMGRPLLSLSKEVVSETEIHASDQGDATLFLINSKQTRRTKPLVKLFLEEYSSQESKSLFQRTIAPLTKPMYRFFSTGKASGVMGEFCSAFFLSVTALFSHDPLRFSSPLGVGVEGKYFRAQTLRGRGGGRVFGHDK